MKHKLIFVLIAGAGVLVGAGCQLLSGVSDLSADRNEGMGGGGAAGSVVGSSASNSTGSGGSGGGSSSTGMDGGLARPSCTGNSSSENQCGGANGSDFCCKEVAVQGGTFNRDNGSVQATVSPFSMDVYEVTVARFRAFVDAGQGVQINPPNDGAGAAKKIANSGWKSAWSSKLSANTAALRNALACDVSTKTWADSPGSTENLPITCVSWYEAFAFCIWDNARLPTEAEWNFAAANGTEQRKYPWASGTLDHTNAVYECYEQQPSAECVLADILPVGSKPAGAAAKGQLDLAGSVAEFVLDANGAYITPCDDCANLDDTGTRVLRGGSWDSSPAEMENTFREGISPDTRTHSLGFRCVHDL